MGAFKIHFRTYPVNHVMKTAFSIAGNDFEAISGPAGSLASRADASDQGLRFDDSGVRVVLYVATDVLEIKAASFGTPVSLLARDRHGAIVHTQSVVPVGNIVHVKLTATAIQTVELTGGNNEGMLFELSTPSCTLARESG